MVINCMVSGSKEARDEGRERSGIEYQFFLN